jgi:hypothetical protein
MIVVPATKIRLDDDLHIFGAKPTGVTKKVAVEFGREITEAYRDKGRTVRLKGMRFIPSSRTDFGGGAFEVLANTVIEVEGQEGRPARSEAVDAVLTIGKGKGQVLRTVKIPALGRLIQVG